MRALCKRYLQSYIIHICSNHINMKSNPKDPELFGAHSPECVYMYVCLRSYSYALSASHYHSCLVDANPFKLVPHCTFWSLPNWLLCWCLSLWAWNWSVLYVGTFIHIYWSSILIRGLYSIMNGIVLLP